MNSSPRQTHERRVLHKGASFAFCAELSRGGPGWAVTRCLGVLTTGSPVPPLADWMGRRKSLRVSRRAGCLFKTRSVPVERSLPPGSGALGRGRRSRNQLLANNQSVYIFLPRHHFVALYEWPFPTRPLFPCIKIADFRPPSCLLPPDRAD